MATLMQKLGLKPITEMTELELKSLVEGDRQHRALARAAGKVKRIQKDNAAPKSSRPQTLESTGLAASLILKLRLTGKSDAELIKELKMKGLIS